MASGGGDLKSIFNQYARFGKTEAQAKEKDIRLESKNIQKMMKDSGVVDAKYSTQLLDNDISRVLGKLTSGGTYAKGIKTFEIQGFKQLIDQVAESKKTTPDQIISQISAAGGPSLSNTTGTAQKGITDRMTDTKAYTGSHKERFTEDGAGKGKAGRVDEAKNTGYVGGYKEEGTYDKRH